MISEMIGDLFCGNQICRWYHQVNPNAEPQPMDPESKPNITMTVCNELNDHMPELIIFNEAFSAVVDGDQESLDMAQFADNFSIEGPFSLIGSNFGHNLGTFLEMDFTQQDKGPDHKGHYHGSAKHIRLQLKTSGAKDVVMDIKSNFVIIIPNVDPNSLL